MRRLSYIGEKPAAASGIAVQAEAISYFAAMTTVPSAAFKEAVNRAIYRWKAVGVWPLVTHLWLLCAETAQAALLNMTGSTAATLIGGPTFTPSKGYSGFSTVNAITFPVAGSGSNMVGCIAGLFDPVADQAITSNSGGGRRAQQYRWYLWCGLIAAALWWLQQRDR